MTISIEIPSDDTFKNVIPFKEWRFLRFTVPRIWMAACAAVCTIVEVVPAARGKRADEPDAIRQHDALDGLDALDLRQPISRSTD